MLSANIIGDIGENTVALRLSKYGIFKVYFLGEKAPIEDFLLEIIDEAHPYHCLIQVKAIDQAKKYDKNGNMKTPVLYSKLKKLIERPLPTYVAGADIEEEVIFIAPAFDVNIRYNTIPPILKIDNVDKVRSKSDLEKLRDDIINYWNQANLPNFKKHYISTL